MNVDFPTPPFWLLKATNAEVSQFILDYVQAKPFLLIERVAYEVAEQLQQRFGISWLRLKLSKPKAVAQANNVGIIVERGELK